MVRAGMITLLHADGYQVTAVQLSLTLLADDVAVIQRALTKRSWQNSARRPFVRLSAQRADDYKIALRNSLGVTPNACRNIRDI